MSLLLARRRSLRLSTRSTRSWRASTTPIRTQIIPRARRPGASRSPLTPSLRSHPSPSPSPETRTLNPEPRAPRTAHRVPSPTSGPDARFQELAAAYDLLSSVPAERRVKARRAAQKWHAATAAAAREAEEQAEAAAAEAHRRALEERRRVDRQDAGFVPPVAGQVPPRQPKSPERPPPRPAPEAGAAGAAAAAAAAASGGVAGEGAAEAGSAAAARPESKAAALRSALVGEAEQSVPLLELGCLLRACICLDGCLELSRQACTAAASCLCGDPKLPASSHGAGREHSSSGCGNVPGSRRDFNLVSDFAKANERAREEVRV